MSMPSDSPEITTAERTLEISVNAPVTAFAGTVLTVSMPGRDKLTFKTCNINNFGGI
jgi:hypothetical protein